MIDQPEIVIVDYGLGNLFSISQACKAVGLKTNITSNKSEIEAAQALILPGVGAFGEAMYNLKNLDLIGVLTDFAAAGKPFMGVCLGMQLLFTKSEEFGTHLGLHLIKGSVNRFPGFSAETGEKIKVPQVGWNNLFRTEDRNWIKTPLEHLQPDNQVYFVHSYFCEPENTAEILAKTTYGGVSYCSAIQKDNIFAVQFHPEKSGPDGLKIYANWARNIKQQQK